LILEGALTPEVALPDDHLRATLVGRVWRADVAGPSVVSIRGDTVCDISESAPTITDVLNADDPLEVVGDGKPIGEVSAILFNSAHTRRETHTPWFLAPVDLQPVKASGVTFAASLLERVIEEQAGGDRTRADQIRREVTEIIGSDLARIEPGSEGALRLKERLIDQGMWSQYLEVGIGPDAEIFTKAAPMSSVGTGAEVGILASSEWNNPEPELAIYASSGGRIVGVSLANDVNLRDIEGRSALLLGKAKDNNAASAVGPFLRLFDTEYTLDDARSAVIDLDVTGEDGFAMHGSSSLDQISRDITVLTGAAIGEHHQYPDGVVLMSGTMFAPIDDRDEPGQGFTHHLRDVVSISSARLGTLVNRVNYSHLAAPWKFGLRDLMQNLHERRLLR
jgi:fumarylacetoacetate (FAA) hydrolase family protein